MAMKCLPDIGHVVAGSQNVFSDGLSIARQGDPTCTSISEGSDSVFANGIPVARIGDANTIHCTPMSMSEGSDRVFSNGIGVCRLGDANTPHLKPNWAAIIGSVLPADFGLSTVYQIDSLGLPGLANFTASTLGVNAPGTGWAAGGESVGS